MGCGASSQQVAPLPQFQGIVPLDEEHKRAQLPGKAAWSTKVAAQHGKDMPSPVADGSASPPGADNRSPSDPGSSLPNTADAAGMNCPGIKVQVADGLKQAILAHAPELLDGLLQVEVPEPAQLESFKSALYLPSSSELDLGRPIPPCALLDAMKGRDFHARVEGLCMDIPGLFVQEVVERRRASGMK
eukprot:gb/GFBE01014736.1/.p1 GENE.gb/GFBE01014736.1/~~gb/GFBE01014736.1/.p1  ORF type:complete len:188 (+),score=42.34 gb/GFBE01014736.1/:1-564(+)